MFFFNIILKGQDSVTRKMCKQRPLIGPHSSVGNTSFLFYLLLWINFFLLIFRKALRCGLFFAGEVSSFLLHFIYWNTCYLVHIYPWQLWGGGGHIKNRLCWWGRILPPAPTRTFMSFYQLGGVPFERLFVFNATFPAEECPVTTVPRFTEFCSSLVGQLTVLLIAGRSTYSSAHHW